MPDRSRGAVPLAIVTILLLALPARAADWPVPRGPSHEPAPYRFNAKQVRRVPKEFLEDASACILYSGTTCLIEDDGTVETITHEITRFNGRKGIEKLGEYRSITYDPAYQKLTLNEARVHKADGRVVGIEPRHVQLRDLSTDYQVYDPEKQLIISFPNLDVGDAIEVKWTTRGKNPEYQGQFFTRYNFGDDRFPVAVDELRVRLPKSRTLKYAVTGGKLEPTVREEGDRRTYRWRSTNRRELPQDENLPPKEELRLELACSTFASWEEVGKWKRQLRSDCWECSPEIQKVVEQVTKGLTTPEEKARALTYWVRRRIRYVSVGAEKHDFTPHPPDEVLASRYGDCKDQSQLLAVMLRAAGVPVALATLGTLEDGQVLEEVPSPWGTHAILLVTLDGKDHWIDTTLSLAAWDYLPREDRERLCYVVDEDSVRLLRTPAATAEQNRVEQTTNVSVGVDGSSRSRRTSAYRGSAALAQREAWVEVPPGERRRLVATELQEASSQARLCKVTIDEAKLKDFDQPVEATFEFENASQFSGDPEREGNVGDSVVWNRLLAYTLDYDREVPLQLGGPFESVHRYVVQLPPAYRFGSLPKGQNLHSRWGTFTLKVQPDPKDTRRLELEFHTRLDKTRVAVEDFDAFREFHEAVYKHYRAVLELRPGSSLDDAVGLEALLALTPGDSASATILARMYVQHGLPSEARRVLQRAHHYHPDERELWELSVQVAGDLEEQEAAHRELVKRFPDEPKYVIALGATRIRRGDYAGAREVLKPVAEEAPANWRGAARYQLARCDFLQDRPADALKELEAAGEADPESVAGPAARQLKGRVYQQLGRPGDAVAAYRLALEVDPDSEEALTALVRLCLAEKNTTAALDYLRRYTVLADKETASLVRAAEFHLQLKRYDDALDLATRALQERPSADAERVVGLVHLRRREYAKAAAHLEQANPDGEVVEGLLRADLAAGKLRDAEKHLERAAALKSTTPKLRHVRAAVQALAKRREKLRKETGAPPDKAEALEKAIDAYLCADQARAEGRPTRQVEALLTGAFPEGVDLGPAHALRGLLELEKGRLRQALAEAERGLAVGPADATAYLVRGRARLERGADGAVSDLTRAADLSRHRDARILHWLAGAQLQVGRPQEALATQRAAVKLRPHDPELAEQLRQLERQLSRQPSVTGS